MSRRLFPLLALLAATLAPASAQAAPPLISQSTVVSVATESATLQALLDPNGKATQYHFEYGTEDCSANPCTALPNGPTVTGSSPPQTVQTPLSGLAQATTYHFRLIAKNSSGEEAKGQDTVFRTYGPPQIFGPCPANEAFRVDKPSADLPDCRAYEQASPVQKSGQDARAILSFARASEAGDRVAYAPAGGMPGAEGGQDMPSFLASRSEGSWSSQGLLPPASQGEFGTVLGWSPDFSETYAQASKGAAGSGGTTLLSRSTATGITTTVVPYGEGLQHPAFAGASKEGSEALFEAPSALGSIPASLDGKPNLYLWQSQSEELTLAGVLNDGNPPPAGALAGPYDWFGPLGTKSGGAAHAYFTQDQNTVSADGKSVFFTAAGSGRLYVRRNPTKAQSPLGEKGECTDPNLACTIRLSASKKKNGKGLGGTDSAGERPAAFQQAAKDGSWALFTSTEKLTDDANTGPELPPASIARSTVGGTEKKLDLLFAKARGLAIDESGEHLYWADPEDGTIGRASLDAEGNPSDPDPDFITPGPTEFETYPFLEPGVMHSGPAKPQYVTVDGEYLYWTNTGPLGGDDDFPHKKEELPIDGAGTIGRAKIGPSGELLEVDPDFIAGASNPQGIDAQAEFLYWSNAGDTDPTRTVARAKKLDGSELNQALITVGGIAFQHLEPQGLAVNAGHIYVAVDDEKPADGNYMLRFDLDGGNEKTLAGDIELALKGVALDSTYVYWAESTKNTIGRMKLDLSEGPEPGFITEAGHPTGLAASAGHLFWSANQESPPNPGNDLYRWDYDAQTGSTSLTDMAPDDDPSGAQVLGLLGASADGKSAYVAANGDLDGADAGQAGDCKAAHGTGGPSGSGECGLWLLREGRPPLHVARLDADSPDGDAENWLPLGFPLVQKTARVSTDGQTLLFRSRQKLTAYDNQGKPELYLFRVGEGVDCISCSPSGEAPVAAANLGDIYLSLLVPNQPAPTLSRNLSADGRRVFFQTADALVGADENGRTGCPIVGPKQGQYLRCGDAYEWEAAGAGSCSEESPAFSDQNGGCLYLLSSGKSSDASYLFDASSDGEHVFIATRDPFVRQDEDQLFDVYDAAVGGGLSSQNTIAPTPCEGEACRAAPTSPPGLSSPGSATFSGPPDRVKRQAKKKKRKHHRAKHRSRKGHTHQSRRKGR